MLQQIIYYWSFIYLLVYVFWENEDILKDEFLSLFGEFLKIRSEISSGNAFSQTLLPLICARVEATYTYLANQMN